MSHALIKDNYAELWWRDVNIRGVLDKIFIFIKVHDFYKVLIFDKVYPILIFVRKSVALET